MPKPSSDFDGLGSVILHAVEDDQPAAWRLDPVGLDLKLPLELELPDRVVHEFLRRLRQHTLHLADTDDAGGPIQQAALYSSAPAKKLLLPLPRPPQAAL